jgi:adenosine deaminase
MSQTSLSEEFLHLGRAFGWDLGRVRWATINAMKSAFLPFDDRLRLINRVIKPGYAMLGADG